MVDSVFSEMLQMMNIKMQSLNELFIFVITFNKGTFSLKNITTRVHVIVVTRVGVIYLICINQGRLTQIKYIIFLQCYK